MGTTYSWYYVKNQGQTREDIRAGVAKLPKSAVDPALEFLTRRVVLEIQKHLDEIPPEQLTPQLREQAAAQIRKMERGDAAYAAFRPDAPFFPVFATQICEGYNSSFRDCKGLYKIFRAPVLAFSVYDSDIAFVSFFDGKAGWDFARAPEGYEEYDEELYSSAFPDFLLELCPSESRDEVRSVWDDPSCVFADDKVTEITGILGVPMLIDDDPRRGLRTEGWEIVDAE